MTNELYDAIREAVIKDIAETDIENYYWREIWCQPEDDEFDYKVLYSVIDAELHEDRQTGYWERTYRVQVTKINRWIGEELRFEEVPFDDDRLFLEGEV